MGTDRRTTKQLYFPCSSHHHIYSTKMEQQLPVADVATQGGPVYIVIDREDNKQEKQFAKKTSKILAIIQIVLGAVSIFCQIGIIIERHVENNEYYNQNRSDYWRYYSHHIITGEGVYCGISFIIAGILGVVASRKSTTCNISAFLVLSIIASLFAATQFIFSVINTSLVFHADLILTLVYIVLTISALAEGVVAIVCSALCCGACCCSGAGPRSGQVLYPPGAGVNGTAMVVNQGRLVTANVQAVNSGVAAAAEANVGLPSYEDVAAVAVEGGTGQTEKKHEGYNYERF